MPPLLLAIVILVSVWTLVVLLALAYAFGRERERAMNEKKLNKLVDNWYPLSPKPEITGFKYRIREEFGLEQPTDVRRPYW